LGVIEAPSEVWRNLAHHVRAFCNLVVWKRQNAIARRNHLYLQPSTTPLARQLKQI
jgi:hypothetical protein